MSKERRFPESDKSSELVKIILEESGKVVQSPEIRRLVRSEVAKHERANRVVKPA